MTKKSVIASFAFILSLTIVSLALNASTYKSSTGWNGPGGATSQTGTPCGHSYVNVGIGSVTIPGGCSDNLNTCWQIHGIYLEVYDGAVVAPSGKPDIVITPK